MYTHDGLPSNGVHASQPAYLTTTSLIDAYIRTMAFHRTAYEHHSHHNYEIVVRCMYTHDGLPSTGDNASQPI